MWDPGETESQTAEREVFEETGLRVKIDRRYRAENRYNIRHDTQKLAVIFAAVTDQEQLNPQPGGDRRGGLGAGGAGFGAADLTSATAAFCATPSLT